MELRRKLVTLFAATSILPVLLLIYVSVVYILPQIQGKVLFFALLFACVVLSLTGFSMVVHTARRLAEIGKSLRSISLGSVHDEKDELSMLSSAAREMKERVDQQRQEIWQLRQQQAVLKLELQKSKTEARNSEPAELVPGTWDIQGWQDYLVQEIERAKRYHKSFCILLARVYHFKEKTSELPANEHEELVKLVTEKLHSMVRDSDLIAGGPRKYFGIMLPETDPKGGEAVGNRLVARFESESFVTRGSLQGLNFQLCIGIASYPYDARDAATMLEYARKSLDDAEKNGAGTAMRFDRHTME